MAFRLPFKALRNQFVEDKTKLKKKKHPPNTDDRKTSKKSYEMPKE